MNCVVKQLYGLWISTEHILLFIVIERMPLHLNRNTRIWHKQKTSYWEAPDIW